MEKEIWLEPGSDKWQVWALNESPLALCVVAFEQNMYSGMDTRSV